MRIATKTPERIMVMSTGIMHLHQYNVTATQNSLHMYIIDAHLFFVHILKCDLDTFLMRL